MSYPNCVKLVKKSLNDLGFTVTLCNSYFFLEHSKGTAMKVPFAFLEKYATVQEKVNAVLAEYIEFCMKDC